MNYLIQSIPLKIKLIGLALLVFIIILTALIASQTPAEQPESETKFSLQKVTPGENMSPDLEKNLIVIDKQATSSGKIIYSLDSDNPLRNDQVITDKNQVVFERIYVPENPSDPNHLLISKSLEKYGKPEQVVTGSKLWGPYMNLYIYNSQGVAFIGNPNTDEVYEIQFFKPLSLEEYIKSYGDDIDTTPPGPES